MLIRKGAVPVLDRGLGYMAPTCFTGAMRISHVHGSRGTFIFYLTH